ncbi:MAG: PfkB family carbohydrate kinase [Marinilabiliales bacterium]
MIVAGCLGYDTITTPFDKIEKTLGGASAYSALAASYFCNKVKILSVVGGDFDDSYFKLFKKKKIDISGIEIKKDLKSFRWHGKYYNDMNICKTMSVELNAIEQFEPVIPKSYQNSKYLLIGSLDPVKQRKTIEGFKKRPKLIMMDTQNYWITHNYEELIKTLAVIDILTINDEEARHLSGEYSLSKAAKKILKFGPKFLIINKGKHGTLLFHKKNVFFAPSLPLEEIFDPTGSGDAFSGGFLGYICKTHDLSFDNMKRAVIFGSAIASFCVEKFGTEMIQNITVNKLNQRVQDFINLVQFDFSLK